MNPKLVSYSLPIALATLALTVGMMTSGLSYASFNQSVQAFEKTEYDFLVSNFREQSEIDNLMSQSFVEEASRFYNFTTRINGGVVTGNVFFGLDHNHADLSFFNDGVLTQGQWDPNQMVIDTNFAETFALSLGETMTFMLNGELVSKTIAGIFLHSNTESFNKGIAMTIWTPQFETLFDNELTVDLVFIKTSSVQSAISYLEQNNISYLQRSVLLGDAQRAIEMPLQLAVTISVFVTLLILIATIVWFNRNLRLDSKEIEVKFKEKREKENTIYRQINLYASILGGFFLLAVFVVIFMTIPFLSLYGVLLLIYLSYFPLMMLITQAMIQSFTGSIAKKVNLLAKTINQ
jgi:hypothetical protein